MKDNNCPTVESRLKTRASKELLQEIKEELELTPPDEEEAKAILAKAIEDSKK